MRLLTERVEELTDVCVLEEETIRMAEETVLLRLSTKHINLWVRQLDMKRKEICELAELMGFEEVKEEIVKRGLSKDGHGARPTHPEEDEEGDI